MKSQNPLGAWCRRCGNAVFFTAFIWSLHIINTLLIQPLLNLWVSLPSVSSIVLLNPGLLLYKIL